jgi:hypothetical protein
MNIEECHRELTETIKRNYSHLKYSDAELGKNEEAGRFLLGQDPKHCVYIVHDKARTCLGIYFVLDSPVDPQLVTITDETQGLLRFDLRVKIVSLFDTSLFPVVRCIQYRDRRVRAVNILVEIDQHDLPMDLVLAIIETLLIDYMIK